jgi:hypothetical protein
MSTTAASLLDWTQLGRIVAAALVGGTGVVVVFGLLLLSLSRSRTAAMRSTRYGLYAVSGLCGVLIVAVAAAGLYAMTRKPSSSPSPAPAPAGASASRDARSSPSDDDVSPAVSEPPAMATTDFSRRRPSASTETTVDGRPLAS